MADVLEQLRLTQQSQDAFDKGKPLGGALGAMLGSLGIKLRDVDSFAIRNPNGLFTKDVDMASLFRNTKAGQELNKIAEDMRQAATDVKIGAVESGEDVSWSSLVRGVSGKSADTMERT